ncbi:MAG: hypothetical protein ACREKS_14605 [Candidatus Rokuibacteriota bacterium]
MRRGLVGALLAPLVPSAASACTWCVSSAFGDRTFSWPYLGLLVAPFVIGSTIAAVLWFYSGRLKRGDAPRNAKRLPSSVLDKETR